MVTNAYRWREVRGREIFEGYGQTETTLIYGNFANSPLRPGSRGLPGPEAPLHVIDEARAVCLVGIEGDVAIKVDNNSSSTFFGLFDGYLGVDGSLQRNFIRDANNEEWYPTGDRATIDHEIYF